MLITNSEFQAAYNLYCSIELKSTDVAVVGQARRYANMKKRLSIGFAQTAKETDEKGRLLYAHNRNSKGILIPVLYTLTYPDNDFWHYKDISKFLNKLSSYAKRRHKLERLRYFWVCETTKKGVIHYHIVAWFPRTKNAAPKPTVPLKFNNREYPPLWKFWAKVEGVRKGVYSYLLKYISKGTIIGGLGYEAHQDGKLRRPRLYGYGGLTTNQREFLTYCMIPKYIKKVWDCVEYGDKIQRVKGGWILKTKSKIRQIYKYKTYCYEQILSNFNKYIVPSISGHSFITYKYGENWSLLPDNTHDVWYPF